jgi:hypothetical protein
MRVPIRSRLVCAACVIVAALTALAGASSASAVGTPKWKIVTFATPTSFTPNSEANVLNIEHNVLEEHVNVKDSLNIFVSNVGGAASNSGPVTIAATLSPGVTGYFKTRNEGTNWGCPGETSLTSSPVPCTSTTPVGPMEQQGEASLRLFENVGSSVPVGSDLATTITVSGGGAPLLTETVMTEVTGPSTQAPFGIASLSGSLTNLGGEPDTQAADHPNGLITGFGVNTSPIIDEFGITEYDPAQSWKDIVADLPPGVVANPQVTLQCPFNELISGSLNSDSPISSNCPPGSKVGKMDLDFHGGFSGFNTGISVYNMVPEGNEPAEFAFNVGDVPLSFYPTVVGNGADAHIRVTTPGIPYSSYVHLGAVAFNFFGDPNEQSAGDKGAPTAFFTNSSDCAAGPQVAELHVDSYQESGSWVPDGPNVTGTPNFTDGTPDFSDPAWKGAKVSQPAVTGCEKLHFDPSLSVQPETTKADEPSGMAVDIRVPQNTDPHGLATPPFKAVTVTLPSGVSLSPGAADGLQACTEAQFEPQSNNESSCPNASVLGTLTATTPLLPAPLTGYVFLGQPECGADGICTNQDAADGKMFKLLIQVEGEGIVQKVQGTVSANTTTGQLTAHFPDNPQFPVSNLQLVFKGGLRAGLATPQNCGNFTATSDMVPWSTPYTPDATPSASLDISWNGQGEACPASPPLTPSFSAGTSNPNAGQFSPLTLTFAREDRQQDLSGIQVKTPPGLLGSITGVPLCSEVQANAGTCSAASRIGTMTVAAGPGGHPFYTQGSIYLTEHYDGAPFGLSIVVPTVAGPFNLGNVVVRSRINIDENTAALTVTSNPLPQILDGIPLRLRTANVTIERPNFILNPTSCAQQHIEASISGAQGATANVSSPFAVAGCAGLHFGPKFTVSTSGKTSRADGASLDAKVVFPAGAQSNIRTVKVDLPKQLPSRLTTLQKACTAAQFESNPAGCPAASVIGTARTSTPILPVELTGPVYFVSHGGEAFPSLIVVLQGDGVRVDLTASTFISKKGITSSTFRTIPDVPVSSFEIYLPEGKDSALAANGNLCSSSLEMPTSFTAQDGSQLKQDTKLAVTGCPKAKKATKKKKKKAKAKKSSNARKSSYGQGGQS